MKKSLFLFTTILLLAFTTADVRSFYAIPYPANAITATDYDLDGDLDILINFDRNYQLQFDKGGVFIMQNDSKGHFTYMDSIISSTGGSSWDIRADTVLNNSFPDIIYSSDSIYVISTDGINYIFHSFYHGEMVNDFALGDVNGDYSLDVVFSSNNDKYWGIVYNQGDSSCAEPVYYNLDFHPTDITCGKLNDGDKDYVLVLGSGTSLYYYSDTGFVKKAELQNAYKASFNDLDNDGDNDIITFSDIYVASLMYIYENKGNDVLDSVGFYRIPEGCSDFFITDFNNDSLPDVLFLTHDFWNESMMLYYNKGNFQFGDSVIIKVKDYGEARRFMYCADLDGNGYNDILLTRQVYDTTYAPSLLQLFFNDGKGNFVTDPPEGVNEHNQTNKLSLLCYPNPFTNSLKIKYELKNKANILVDIYNMQGQKIKTMIKQKTQPPGEYQLVWNGTCKNGKEVTNGTYLIRLQVGRQVTTRTVVKIN
jgi:hypothetical protein